MNLNMLINKKRADLIRQIQINPNRNIWYYCLKTNTCYANTYKIVSMFIANRIINKEKIEGECLLSLTQKGNDIAEQLLRIESLVKQEN